MTEEDMIALTQDGYLLNRELPDGRILSLYRMMFTIALCVMRPGYAHAFPDNGRITRYCYAHEHIAEAIDAVADWDGSGDPPGPWIKQKEGGIDRLNPALANEDFGNDIVTNS